jgi:hypothetical protein
MLLSDASQISCRFMSIALIHFRQIYTFMSLLVAVGSVKYRKKEKNKLKMCCSCRWGGTLSLKSGHQRAYCSFPGDIWSSGGTILTEKAEELGEKLISVPLYPPQIRHGITRTRTRAWALRSRRLTAWAVRQPKVKILLKLSEVTDVWCKWKINYFSFWI